MTLLITYLYTIYYFRPFVCDLKIGDYAVVHFN